MTKEISTNPSALLQATFEHIAATRMADVPILNPALQVEAVGFQPWQEGWLGVLITPWFMNLLFLPPAGQPRIATGKKLHFQLPSGDYEFLASEEDRLGPYLASSLFSPMHEFANPDDARAVAEAVMAEVMRAPDASTTPAADQPDPSRRAFFRRLLPSEKE